ncbi:uncharacterized protein YrrD [Pedobacter sp. AK017]|uniref:PRC-barrel domain-containing protein n=1 Tax=Pedobacter sp. AK017 TaxID=2723073 RepID=UPI00161C7D1E|nr:PRC-barrel domain-containing protein [Pedobacter sp. AK017]MBB5438090.1 uncharacterized protein YrrD [Pedobacter sp. AK017]
MQIHGHQIFGVSLGATDGEIGKIKDLYFDDSTWSIRYFVIETGNWLFQRKVLIAPCAIESPEKITDLKVIPVHLTKDQVKNSPDIDTDMPVSRQQESSLFDHYSWPAYGGAGKGFPTTGMFKGTSALQNKLEQEKKFDPHLRSLQHISSYDVCNQIGRVGQLKDVIINLSDWSIPYLLMDDIFTSDQDRVILEVKKIISIDWDTNRITVSSGHDELEKAPRINASGFFSDDSNLSL